MPSRARYRATMVRLPTSRSRGGTALEASSMNRPSGLAVFAALLLAAGPSLAQDDGEVRGGFFAPGARGFDSPL